MVIRENAFLEASKCLNSSRASREKKKTESMQEKIDERNQFMNNYYSLRESRVDRERRHSQLLENAMNNALSTVLKSIYITALEAGTLTDNGIILAENMVDSWIKEKGGALKIFGECKDKTYLLSRLHQIVEDAAEEEVKEIEKNEDDTTSEEESKNDKDSKEESPKEDKTKDDSDKDKESENKETKDSKDEKPEDNDKDSKEEKSEDKTEGSEDEKSDNTEDDSDKESENKETKDSSDNPLNIIDFEDEEESPQEDKTEDDNDPSDDQTDAAEEIIDDIEVDDTPVSVDGEGEENNGKVFDELEKEEDVRKAIELIRQRVADAEEAFIKRNAEDKKQIDELLAKISDNVKTVEDLSDDDSTESKIAQESARLNKQKIKNITENRPLTILEKMTRNLSSGIIKDQSLREQYVTESGELDTFLVIESAKVMYAFLETVSTLQLEKVDSAYITKALSEM